jgi:hypothetical protein
MKFECIKGLSTSDDVSVIVMQGDVVVFNESEEGMVYVEGIAGWCKGLELNFTPKQFTECFKVIGISYTL